MCGIIIYFSKNKENIIENIVKSLYNIQNRGYDSVGISYMSNNTWNIEKFATTDTEDSFEVLKNKLSDISSNIAIAHTRWATHGSRSYINAHPHISMNKKIILVHNGIINNYVNLKDMLIKNNYVFVSETDTEVIANLIEYELSKTNNINNAIKNAQNKMEGTWALGIIYTEEIDKIYITRHGSPLLLGESEKHIICTSEVSGFIGLVNNYIILNNDDLIILTKNGYITDDVYELNNINYEYNFTTPEPYKYWTLKEIYEQPLSINRAINNGGRIKENKIILRGLDYLKNFKDDIDNIIGLGCGTSYHATMLLKYYFGINTNINLVQSFDASEFTELDIPKKGKTLFIICSQSGETRDLIHAISICKKYNGITLGVINVVDSMISKMVDCGVYLNCGSERAVASTKSFTSVLIVLSLIAMWFNNNINNINKLNNLRNLPNNVYKILNSNKLKTDCNNLANFIKERNIENLFILGYDKLFAIAKEGALKIKEISYIHAEAYPSKSLKHGPFALLDKKSITIILIDKKNIDNLLSTYHEIISRDTNCMVITDSDNPIIENKIILPEIEYYSEILFVITLQYIAYELSQIRNINPDRPRNLAKVVTVE